MSDSLQSLRPIMSSYVYPMERVSKKRLGARSDFDEWASQVVAAVKTHRSRFGESAGGAPPQSRIGLRRWASREVTKIAD